MLCRTIFANLVFHQTVIQILSHARVQLAVLKAFQNIEIIHGAALRTRTSDLAQARSNQADSIMAYSVSRGRCWTRTSDLLRVEQAL